jgi:hypothetical protein
MNDFDDYHDYWKILHSNEHNNTEVRFLNLIYVLNNLKTNTSCDCGQSASDFLIDMLNLDNEDVNYYIVKQKFLSLKNTDFFFQYFHNLINLKLGKNIFLV